MKFSSLPFIYKEELLTRLRAFDNEARISAVKILSKPQVVILGGSAFILLDKIERATYDIDVLTMPREFSDLIERYDMNLGVSAYMDSLPYNYEDRLVSVDIEGSFLKYFTPSLEDLVITKLYAMRPSDEEDITSDRVLASLDWELLEKLVFDKNEAAASALVERRYKEMVHAFQEYKERYRK